MLFEKRPGAIWPVRIPEQNLRDWQTKGQEIESLLKDRKVIFCSDEFIPIIDEEEFSVRWKGRTYTIGNNNEFRLMILLVKARGQSVSYATICNHLGFECAIHQTVWRLKQRLPDDLRKCISNRAEKVRLDLPQPAWCS